MELLLFLLLVLLQIMAASCVHAEHHAPQPTAISGGVNFILAQLYRSAMTTKRRDRSLRSLQALIKKRGPMFTHSPDQARDLIVPGSHVPQKQQRAILAFTVTIIGIVAYVLFNVIAQLLPPHYSPITQSISDLAVGPYGWLLAVIFLLYSVLSLAFLLGYIWGTSKEGRSRVGVFFLAIWGVLPGVLAFLPTDIVDAHGYPGAVQALHMTTTLHGMLHIVLSLIAFSSAMLATLFISLRFSRDARLRSLRTPALLIALLMWPTFLLTDTFGRLGLYGVDERLFVGLGLLWMLIVALWIRRRLQGDASNRSLV